MDKRLFKSWVLHIPHSLRYLLWIVKSLSSVSPIFFSLIMSFFLCVLFPESAESNHFLMAHIPWMNESHDLEMPFKVVITTFSFSTSSSTASSCSLIWETLVKYDCMVSHSSIGFLKSSFDLCSSLQIAWSRNQNISLGVFREETCGIRWSLIELAMIFLALTKFLLCKDLASSPSGNGTSLLM